MSRRHLRPALLFAALVHCQIGWALSLVPGSIVVLEGGTKQIMTYESNANLLDALALTTEITHPSGLTVIGRSVYVLSGDGQVGRVDLNTGAITGAFAVDGNTALGDNGKNLLVSHLQTNTITEYTS